MKDYTVVVGGKSYTFHTVSLQLARLMGEYCRDHERGLFDKKGGSNESL